MSIADAIVAALQADVTLSAFVEGLITVEEIRYDNPETMEAFDATGRIRSSISVYLSTTTQRGHTDGQQCFVMLSCYGRTGREAESVELAARRVLQPDEPRRIAGHEIRFLGAQGAVLDDGFIPREWYARGRYTADGLWE